MAYGDISGIVNPGYKKITKSAPRASSGATSNQALQGALGQQDPNAAVGSINGRYYNYAGDFIGDVPQSTNANKSVGSYDPAAAQRAAQRAAEEAQRGQLRGDAANLINNLVGAYDSLFGSAKTAAASQNQALDKRYTQEIGSLTDQFNQELPKIGRGYAARGTYDSSYRVNAEQEATTGFQNQVQDIGTQREADAAKIGQFVAEKEGMVNAEKGLLAKMLNDLPNVTDINELTQLKQQIDRKIADTQAAASGIQSEAAYRSKLNEIAPSTDRIAGLQSTLSNIINGAAPGALKRAVAQQVIGSSGLNKEEQDKLLGQVNSQIV